MNTHDLDAARARLREELQLFHSDCTSRCTVYAAVTALLDEREQLREALKQYADRDEWVWLSDGEAGAYGLLGTNEPWAIAQEALECRDEQS